MRIFVNRTEEIRILEQLIKTGSRVLIMGLRGYGKTALITKLKNELSRKGKCIVYLDCNAIFSPTDLVGYLVEQLKTCNLVDEKTSELILIKSREMNSKEALENVFKLSEEHEVSSIIFDEISTLIQRISLLKPYRGLGGSISVAQHIKALLNKHSFSVIFIDTSINSMIDLFMDYSSPLFKEFTHKMEIEPLPFTDATILAKRLLELKDVKIDDHIVKKIALYTNGVPIYIRMLTDTITRSITEKEFEEAFFDQLENGVLNDYFTVLLEKFTTAEQEVLLVMSRGKTRYKEIQATTINPAAALESLTKKGIIRRKQVSKKEVHYWIKDRLFASWLATRELPRLKKLNRTRIKTFYLGSEALVREIFRTLKKDVEIENKLGGKTIIKKPIKVTRYEGALGEIDLIAITKNETYIGEIYAGEKYPPNKIDQLLKNMHIAEKLGYKNIKGLAVSLGDYTEKAIQKAKQHNEKNNIILINHETLKQISKHSEIKL